MMKHEFLNLKQAAEHIHLDVNELRHVALRGEIESVIKRGEDWLFEHTSLDEWAQRNLLAVSERVLNEQHRVMMEEHRKARKLSWGVGDYFNLDAIELELIAKTKPGIIRDMTDLADRSGYVYDTEGLFRELISREEAASTAIGNKIALLHPRFHDPYMFEESFIAYGRSTREVFFGAPDGEGTRHFFLICSTDHKQHLHILARLAVLAHGTKLVESLDAAVSREDVLAAIKECEREYRE